MSNERRQAPSRAVIHRQKIGNYGSTEYRHHLECGHIETRKRRLPSPVKCVSCSASTYNPQDEYEMELLRFKLAAKLHVSPDEVTIVASELNGTLELRKAQVSLTPSAVRRLIRR